LTREERKQFNYNKCHKIINGVLHKQCSICKNWFPCTEEFFYTNKTNKNDGLKPYCKECEKNKNYERILNNYSDFKLYYKKYTQGEKHKKYRQKNHEMMKDWLAEWRRQNPDKCKEYRDSRKMHKDHEITEEELKVLYDYADSKCMYCGITEKQAIKKYKQKLHKDHAYNNGSNRIDNCVLACKGCNSDKHDKDWNEWFTSDNPRYTVERYNAIKEWLEMFI
jgi:hypothetical protein